MAQKRAFTLIELLVVIAVIALLLAIVMPVLNKAKVIAAAVVCMANNSSASKAWLSYAEDYKGNLMDGDQSETMDGKETYTIAATGNPVTVWCFVTRPLSQQYTLEDHLTVEHEIRGLEKGALWAYMGGAAKAYNCPADKRRTKAPTDWDHRKYGDLFGGYRTFSIGGVLSHRMLQSGVTSGEEKYVVTKRSQFVNPSGKFVFLEEFDPRGINHKTWNVVLNNNQPKWTDALAMVHNGASTFGYADGHAERHKWTGPKTREFFNIDAQLLYTPTQGPALTDKKDLDDYNWFVQHYIPGRR